MKILYHHRTQGKGVEGVHVRGIIDGFRQLGHEVVVISPPGVDPYIQGTPAGNSRKVVSNGFRISSIWRWLGKHSPEIIFEFAELLYNFWVYFKLRSIVKRKKFDFIYERYALNTFAGLIISRQYNIPLIIEVNDSVRIERVRKLTMRGVAKLIEDRVFKKALSIVTVSSYFKKIISGNGIEAEKVFVLPNAIDDLAFNVKEKKTGVIRDRYSLNGNIVIGYTGAFVYWHRVDLLLDSFVNLVRANKDLRLLLVGDGVAFDSTKKFAKENEIENFVILPGRVPHEDTPSYIEAMDICVIPDSNTYGSPMKLFEYMAMGKPVVAPRLLPMEDVIKNGENGVLFEPKDKNSFEKALTGLLENKEKRERIGLAAKKTVLENHTWQKNAERVINIYQKVRVK